MKPFDIMESDGWFNPKTAFDNIDWQVAQHKYGMRLCRRKTKLRHFGDTYVFGETMYVYFYPKYGLDKKEWKRGWYVVTDIEFDKYDFPCFTFEKASKCQRKKKK